MGSVVGVDIGGTFTDVVSYADGAIETIKVPTTPNPADGVIVGVGARQADVFLHGTTAATNALLEERGAVVALVTQKGFEDLVEIGRQNRPALYDSSADRPPPLVARQHRFAFTGEIDDLTDRVAASDVETVVVGLLEAYADATEELALADVLAEATGLPVNAATRVSPEFREYERLATAILDAYLTPSVAGYLKRLDAAIPSSTRLVMTSSGGLVPFEAAGHSAGRLLLSGPAGGAVAAAALGSHHGHDTVISFDMGGTSTDVARITGGRLAAGSGSTVAGRVNRVPAIPIHTIGAGGGSIAWMDAGGALRVGPRSAGAKPGPVAYRRGGLEPTVTDANLVLGHIPTHLALGGVIELDSSAAARAISELGDELGMAPEQTVGGIIEVVDSHMEHALRAVSVEEGADPREAALVAFGGAGGLHAGRLARHLEMQRVLIPPHSGVFSALGLLLAAPRADGVKTVMVDETAPDLAAALAEVGQQAARSFAAMFGSDHRQLALSADVRYLGQSHELEVEIARVENARKGFEQAHLERFGFTRPGEPVEIVNVRATASGVAPLTWDQLSGPLPDLRPQGEGGIWRRGTLPAGFEAEGPCLVIEANSAVLVAAGDHVRVLGDGTLELTW